MVIVDSGRTSQEVAKHVTKCYPSPPHTRSHILPPIDARHVPKVAVVVPVYNVAPYLRECLDSLLAQTYTNFTIVVVDDGSTDESGKILDEYIEKIPYFDVIRQNNGGISSARNSALAYIEKDGTFEYVAFVDSDDKVLPEFLAHLVRHAIQTQADITVCSLFTFNDNSGKMKIEGLIQATRIIDREEFVELIFSTQRWDHACGAGGMVWKKLFKASVIKGIRFPCDRDIVEDELFCLLVSRGAKIIAFLSEALYCYRKRTNSAICNERFNLQLFKGRALCIEVAKQLSDHSAQIAAAGFANVAVNLCKNERDFLNVDLKPQEALVIEAAKKRFIRRKTLNLYRMFCNCPEISRAYKLCRRVIKTQGAMWFKGFG